MNDIPGALLQQHNKWIEIVNDRNIDAYANLLTENVIWIPPGQKPIAGRQEFKQWLTPFMNKYFYNFSIKEIQMKVSEDWAFERGRFISKMTELIDNKSMEHKGTFSLFWHRESDGNWYIDRYIDDTNL